MSAYEALLSKTWIRNTIALACPRPSTERSDFIMETIIVALDGKESERALPAAQELATQFMSRIVIVHVNQLMSGARGGRFAVHADEDERIARLHEVVAKLRADGFEADLELAATSLGHPAT